MREKTPLIIEIEAILKLKSEMEIRKRILGSFIECAKEYRNNVLELFETLECYLYNPMDRVKYIVFQMMVAVFKKSHEFRVIFCHKIGQIFSLTTRDGYWSSKKATKNKKKSFSKKLRLYSYSTLSKWCIKFGEAYPQLNLYKELVKNKYQIDIDSFDNLSSDTQIVVNGQPSVLVFIFI